MERAFKLYYEMRRKETSPNTTAITTLISCFFCAIMVAVIDNLSTIQFCNLTNLEEHSLVGGYFGKIKENYVVDEFEYMKIEKPCNGKIRLCKFLLPAFDPGDGGRIFMELLRFMVQHVEIIKVNNIIDMLYSLWRVATILETTFIPGSILQKIVRSICMLLTPSSKSSANLVLTFHYWFIEGFPLSLILDKGKCVTDGRIVAEYLGFEDSFVDESRISVLSTHVPALSTYLQSFKCKPFLAVFMLSFNHIELATSRLVNRSNQSKSCSDPICSTKCDNGSLICSMIYLIQQYGS